MGLHTVLFRARTLTKIKINTSPFCVLSSETYRVIHDRNQRRFTVRLDNGGNVQNAVLEYSHGTDGHVRLLSTEVPESFRGKGVAASLAKAALDFVVEEKLKASISCWYIKKYVEENPQHGYQVHIEE
ncbi:protein NATD1-like [Tachysurus fulvidraco]|uniref:protein NATD1-like n=1 Tax=Tachysurus fulvidraco TaxID=1234273 RepID=UPI001FEEFB15|nr:protein NATD1-like [Tachysurus fulvidraco]